jgi:hypothetical protein
MGANGMRRRYRFTFFIAAVVACAVAAAQASAAQWYKADLHAHSVFSADGYPDFGIISQSAKAAGFNAMFVTDHQLGSNFPISSMTANRMFFEDSMRRWDPGTAGTLSSSTNNLSPSESPGPFRTGTQSLHLASTSTTAGETFRRTKRGPLLRSSNAILKFSVNVRRLDAGSGVYVSVSIGGDPTVKDPGNNPVGYTTKSGTISPGKSNVLIWYFGAPPPSSFYGSARVASHPLGTSNCDRAFALNVWVTCTIDVTAAARADIPTADQPLDYNGFKDLKMSAVANGGTADAFFDSYTIDATSSSAEEFVYRTGVIDDYDTSTFKLLPAAEMGTTDHANRFNFGITSQSQYSSYQKGTDGIAPTQATGYPAQLNHPGVEGGVTDQAAIDTNAFGAQILEVRQQHMIDDWDAILRKGVPIVGGWGGDNHTGRWSTSSQSTHIRADALTMDSLLTALKQGRAFLSAGVTGMTFNLDGSSEPYPAATPVTVPSTQTSATVRLSIAGGITSGSTVRWLSNNGSTTTTSVLATDPTSGATYSATKTVPLSGTSTYVRAEVRSSSGTIRGMTQAIVFKRTGASDTTPPTVSVTAPSDGATVSNTVDVNASASDNVGVASVQFTLDGANLGAADTSVPYTVSWNTTTATNGPHTLRAIARDSAGNSTTSAVVNVTVNNASVPPGSITLVGQRTAALTASGTTLSVLVPATAAGNALVASFAVAAGSSKSVTAVTDSSGGTWTKGPVGYQSGSNTRVELWYRTGVPAGITSVTATLSPAGVFSANVSEWSGVASASPLDVQGSRGNAAATAAATPALSTTHADDLVIGAINYPGTATSSLSSSGFTALSPYNAGSVNGRAAYRTVSSTGTYQATWTLSAAAASGGAILALKAGASTPPPPDTTNPTVSVTAPSDGATVSATVEVDASASDNVGVTSVQFTLDGANLGPADTSAPYRVSWDTTTATDASHTLRAIARDAAGNSTTSAPVTVTVDNSSPPPPPPPGGSIALVAQRTGALTASGTALNIPVQATAAGDALVASIALAAGSSKAVADVTDSAGGTWTKGPFGFQSGSNTRVEIWYRTGVPAGITSVTATFTVAGIASANVSEWSGVATASAFDVQAARGNAAATTASTPPLATTNANDLLIAGLNYSGTATSSLSGGGFTALTSYNAGNVNGRAAYRAVSSMGTYTATWTLSAAVTSGTAILALKAG